ncbi:hypothetical protein FACS1894110_19650 [Spirochaetia bacterium]|nr:hypothetical protein FACS1894110_19650 [Spirochaetia bacterium]
MIVTKDISKFLQYLPAIALPQYLTALNAVSDYGYFVSERYVLPFIIRKRLIFQWIEFITGVLNCKNTEDERVFLNEMVKVIKSNHVDFLTCRNTPLFMAYPLGALYCKFGTYRIDLEKPEQELFANLHSKHRNVIRKAEKDGINISNSIENFSVCISLIQETFRRQGKIYPSVDYFERLKALGENVEFWLAADNGEVQGSAVFLWSKGHSCYYMHGGSSNHPHTGAMNYLQWQAILSMKKRGVHYFDFVGARIDPPKDSKLEGIQRFKERFGSTLEEGYLFKYVINKFKYNLYINLLSLMYVIKGEQYKGDIIDQEIKRGSES